MKFSKLIIIGILTVSLISCNQETVDNNKIDNVTNNVVEENMTQNDSDESEEIVTEEEVVVEVKLLPISKVIDGVQKWGYALSDNLDEALINFQYDQPVFFDEDYGFAIVSKNEQVGVIDELGQELIPFGSYESLNLGGGDVIYGQTQDEVLKIFDYNGNVFHVLEEGMYVYLDQNGILQIYDIDNQNYFDIQTKQVVKLESEDSDARKYELMFSNTAYEVQKGLNEKLNVLKEGIPLSEEMYDSVEYVEDYFIIGNESEIMESYYEPINALGLMDQDGHILIDPSYYDLQPLHENYFAVAEFGEYYLNYKQYSDQTYKKAIFRRAEALTGFDFYIIEHVKGDVFYVYDGEEYYFIDVEKNERVMTDLVINGPIDIDVIDDVIVFNHDSYDGTYIIYANEEKIIKRLSLSYPLNNGLVLTKFKGAGINPVFYPLLAYNDSDIENNINNSFKELFDVSKDIDYETGLYNSISSVGFDVSEFNDILVVTQSYYWYGLGAAHGNYGNISYNYDLKTGELLNLKDLFNSEIDIDEVLTLAMKDVVLESQDLADRLYVMLPELTDEEIVTYFKRDDYNFILNSEGLLIYYNPYEIGSYAAGLIEIQVPLESFKEYLNENNPWLAD